MGQKKDYKKSCELWVKAQENLIVELNYNEQNSMKMIEIHTKSLALTRAAIRHENKVLSIFKQKQNE